MFLSAKRKSSTFNSYNEPEIYVRNDCGIVMTLVAQLIVIAIILSPELELCFFPHHGNDAFDDISGVPLYTIDNPIADY